jgi:hypothetical protein
MGTDVSALVALSIAVGALATVCVFASRIIMAVLDTFPSELLCYGASRYVMLTRWIIAHHPEWPLRRRWGYKWAPYMFVSGTVFLRRGGVTLMFTCHVHEPTNQLQIIVRAIAVGRRSAYRELDAFMREVTDWAFECDYIPVQSGGRRVPSQYRTCTTARGPGADASC